jgi:hypothetical protein
MGGSTGATEAAASAGPRKETIVRAITSLNEKNEMMFLPV